MIVIEFYLHSCQTYHKKLNKNTRVCSSFLLTMLLFQGVFLQTTNSSEKRSFAYYYELLADYYEKNAASANKTLEACQNLVGNHHFPSLFALLFYRWLFCPQNFTWKRYNLFLKGVNRIFWTDILLKQVRFRRIYKVLCTHFITDFFSLSNLTLR